MAKASGKGSKKAVARATKRTAASGKGSTNKGSRRQPTPPIPASRQGQR